MPHPPGRLEAMGSPCAEGAFNLGRDASCGLPGSHPGHPSTVGISKSEPQSAAIVEPGCCPSQWPGPSADSMSNERMERAKRTASEQLTR